MSEVSRTAVNGAVVQEAIEAALPLDLGIQSVKTLSPLVFAFFPTVAMTFSFFKFIQWFRWYYSF